MRQSFDTHTESVPMPAITFDDPVLPGDILILRYSAIEVARYVQRDEADHLNRERKSPWDNVLQVSRPVGDTHYYAGCQGSDVKGIARSISATTCRHCLRERARSLEGWRWTLLYNAVEVAYIKSVLGDEVAGNELRGETKRPEWVLPYVSES